MKTLTKQEARNIIEATNGKFFTVAFEKANGELRVMNARTGVKKHLKGGEATYNANNNDNIGVFDQVKGDYRCFNINRLRAITVQGTQYVVA